MGERGDPGGKVNGDTDKVKGTNRQVIHIRPKLSAEFGQLSTPVDNINRKGHHRNRHCEPRLAMAAEQLKSEARRTITRIERFADGQNISS